MATDHGESTSQFTEGPASRPRPGGLTIGRLGGGCALAGAVMFVAGFFGAMRHKSQDEVLLIAGGVLLLVGVAIVVASLALRGKY